MACVLQVTPALDAGGVERTTIEIAEALTRAGHRALVASRGGRLERELRDAGGLLVKLPLDAKNPLELRANADRLARLAQQEKVNIIHARSRAPGWSAFWAAKRLKLPFITTYHGIYNATNDLKRAYNSVMAKGDIVIANSNFTRAHILKEHKISAEKIVVIPRGVELGRFDRASLDADRLRRALEGLSLKGRGMEAVVILPARLTLWKGQKVLLEAAAQLQQRRPGLARYVLAGDAQGRDGYVRQLQEMIAAKGLTDLVAMPGHIEDMAAALAVCDIAVFPSIEPEAFGRSALEAQAMGLPVVAAAHGGLTETIVDGETGLLTPPGDPQVLALAIERLLDLPREARAAMGQRGAARAKALYSTESLQRATLEVYGRVLNTPR
ncbi:MAG: glycosyltransferase family 4 protein [Caulobacterales bacterium]|jgi:glycosyltransferase involved in cell wall biosynthesis